jgi:hypothetical protein
MPKHPWHKGTHSHFSLAVPRWGFDDEAGGLFVFHSLHEPLQGRGKDAVKPTYVEPELRTRYSKF